MLHVVTQYVDTVTAGLTLPPEDKNLLIQFYKCSLLGITLDWMDKGMNFDLLKAVTRINELLEDSGKQAFLKSAKSAEHRL